MAFQYNEKKHASLCHLSSILCLFCFPLNLLIAWALWYFKKEDSEFVDIHGKEALNAQLTCFLYSAILFSVSFLLVIFSVGLLSFLPIVGFLPPAALIWFSIQAHKSIQSGGTVTYPFSIPFVR